MSKEIKDRRALLKGIVAGSAVVGGTKALPEQWSKPLTDSVMLPGHARTTGDWNYGDWESQDYSADDDVQAYTDGYSAGANYENDASDAQDNPSGDFSYGDTNGNVLGGDSPFSGDNDSTGDGL